MGLEATGGDDREADDDEAAPTIAATLSGRVHIAARASGHEGNGVRRAVSAAAAHDADAGASGTGDDVVRARSVDAAEGSASPVVRADTAVVQGELPLDELCACLDGVGISRSLDSYLLDTDVARAASDLVTHGHCPWRLGMDAHDDRPSESLQVVVEAYPRREGTPDLACIERHVAGRSAGAPGFRASFMRLFREEVECGLPLWLSRRLQEHQLACARVALALVHMARASHATE